MTIEELEKVFQSIENKGIKVYMSGYYDTEINGYYIDEREGEPVLILTRLNVQPRIDSEDEV